MDPLHVLARRIVRKLARKRVYQEIGARPPFIRQRHGAQMRGIKAWDRRVREERLDIEREDFVLNP
jgi:hypothetical protein